MENQFKQFQLKPFVIDGLNAMAITAPTPIQQKLFPHFCVVKTLLGKARPVAGKLTPFWYPYSVW